MSFKVGNVVVGNNTPAHFRNIKDGSLWIVTQAADRNGNMKVADRNHKGIRTNARYFLGVSKTTVDHLLADGEGSDISDRLVMLLEETKNAPKVSALPGEIQVAFNGTPIVLPTNVARALARRNGGKVIQRKIAAALGRV